MTKRIRSTSIDFQSAANAAEETQNTETSEVGKEEKKPTNVVGDTKYGPLVKDTFSIRVVNKDEKVKDEKTGKMVPKTVYHNPEEEFTFQKLEYFPNALSYYSGVDFPEEFLRKMEEALQVEDPEENKKVGEAIKTILETLTESIRSTAKNNEYQRLFKFHAPMDKEQKMIAIAQSIDRIIKFSPLSAETAIKMLKAEGAVPEDYTIQQYNETPRRRRKAEEEDGEDE